MWVIIELLIFDNRSDWIGKVLDISKETKPFVVFAHPYITKTSRFEIKKRILENTFYFNEITNKLDRDESNFNLHLSPTNDLWNAPDLNIEEKRSPGDGHFDREASVRRKNIAEYPSYLQFAVPYRSEGDLSNIAKRIIDSLSEASSDCHVIGHGMLRPDPWVSIVESLFATPSRYKWSEDWRDYWLHPAELLFGAGERVEGLAAAVGGKTFRTTGPIAALAWGSRSFEESADVADYFISSRRLPPPDAWSFSAEKGEFFVGQRPFYSETRHKELLEARLIRPPLSDHVLLPLLNEQFVSLAGIPPSQLLVIDAHVAGAERFRSSFQGFAGKTLSEWAEIHQYAWKRAFGLSPELVQFLLKRYFPED
jgi:hypothetical protein